MTTPTHSSISTEARFRGCLLGLACGDAVGASVEFMPRGSFPPVTNMTGGGPWALAPGQWTDDTSMALCLAESLITCGAFEANDQMQRYLRWYRHGHWSSKGYCFDIGTTTRAALARFEVDGDPYAGSTDSYTAGNGSLMRLAPAPMAAWPNALLADEWSALSSRTTHAAPAAIESCRVFAAFLVAAFNGCAAKRYTPPLRTWLLSTRACAQLPKADGATRPPDRFAAPAMWLNRSRRQSGALQTPRITPRPCLPLPTWVKTLTQLPRLSGNWRAHFTAWTRFPHRGLRKSHSAGR